MELRADPDSIFVDEIRDVSIDLIIELPKLNGMRVRITKTKKQKYGI